MPVLQALNAGLRRTRGAHRVFSFSALRSFHSTRRLDERVEFRLADIGEGIAEVEVLQWYVEEGQQISQFDKIVEVQSDKATVDITSRYDGTVASIGHAIGDMAAVGSVLVEIDTEGSVSSGVAETTSVEEATPSTEETPVRGKRRSIGGKTLATPSVRRLAREHDLDLDEVLGTGKDGRVLKSDVLEFIKSSLEQPSVAQAPPEHTLQTTTTTETGSGVPVSEARRPKAEDVVVPVRGIQREMVKSMTRALQIPHFNLMDEICMDDMVELRRKLKPIAASQHGVNLTYMPLILKATSLALLEFPSLNASVVDDACTEVIHHGSHNISVAMDTPRGLLVPTVTDVQDKTLFEIAADIVRLQQLGSENKLGSQELSGGTFSISNIGNIGATYTSPVIMPPQVVIGAIGSMRRLPRFAEDGETVVASTVMNVSWAADHRVVDGATMARFNRLWKSYLEAPISMLSAMR